MFLATEVPLPEYITRSHIPTLCPEVLNKREVEDEEARERNKHGNDHLCIEVAALVEI